MSTTRAFDYAEVPEVVGNYLKAHIVQDYATAVTYLAEDVTVLDDGHTLQGRDETLKAFDASAQQFEVTTTLNSVSKPSDDVWEVSTHLSGNFPGGEVDLRMIFTVLDDTIQELEITV